jgi:hypothetical protein
MFAEADSHDQIASYIRNPRGGLLAFDYVLRCTVNFDGSWKIDEALIGKYTRDNLEDVWAGNYVKTQWDEELMACTKKAQEGRAGCFGEYIMNNKLWSVENGCSWTIKAA